MPCEVMGIVNVTPDSFSDGGRFFSPVEAVRRARNMLAEGAAIIDIGGESTRPGATPIGWREEWARIGQVVGELAGTCRLSVDTYHPETAEKALRAGAQLINCVREESVREMRALVASFAGAELIAPARAIGEGEDLSRIYLDPMIGFGTTREEDLALVRGLGELCRRGRVAVGVSRKRIVKKLTGEKLTGKNLGGGLALALWCAEAGASIVRVHDVRETVQAIRTWNSLR